MLVEKNAMQARDGLPAWVHLDFRCENIAIKMTYPADTCAAEPLEDHCKCEAFLIDFDGSYAVGNYLVRA
jgi:hypothetical protein